MIAPQSTCKRLKHQVSILPHWFIPSLLPLHLVGTSNSNIGDTPTDSALADVVTVAIPSDMCLLTVRLKTLPWNRQCPSSQEDRFNCGIISLLWQGSMHIEPGSQLYNGGNVMILFLGSTLFLISSFCAMSPFLESLYYAYHHYLLILGPLTFTICTL